MRENIVTIRVQTLEIIVRAKLVREVLGRCDWTPIPGARSEIPGLVAWSGRAVAMLDLARLVPGLRELEPGEGRVRTVIVQTNRCTLAIIADAVSEVWQVLPDALKNRELCDFPLANVEFVTPDRALPVFEPALLLTALGIES